MAATSGTPDPDLNQPILRALLKDRPWEFNFFQTVRILHRDFGRRQKVGREGPPMAEVARFGANPSSAFPASQIQALQWHDDKPLAVTVNFMGLFGPMGALPLYYTEYIMQRLRVRVQRPDGTSVPDTALAGFLDIFNHRLISLYYQAWEKYRFYAAYERGEVDRLSRHLLHLIGLGTPGLQKRQEVRDDSLVFYSGLLALHSRSTLGLEQILSDYFDVPVQVEQFRGAWYPLERSSQCRFEEADSYSEQLGIGAVAGDEIWDPQSGVRVRVGPLNLDQYLDFLPGGTAYRPLRALTQFFANGELNFDLQLVLRHDEVPPCELGHAGGSGPRLGWVTWAKTAPMRRDPDETTLRLEDRQGERI